MENKGNTNLADKRILIVDDQRSFQKLLKGMLVRMGAKSILNADTGESAISQINKEPFDVVFIDYNLGDGRNGRQLLDELKYQNKVSSSTTYIMITGESSRSMVLGAVEFEPDDYLVKPFSQGLLKSRLAKIFLKKQLLAPVYECLEHNHIEQAEQLLAQLIETFPRYKCYFQQFLCRILINNHKYATAQEMLNKLIIEKRQSWALTELAVTSLMLKDFNKSLRYCNELLGQNRFDTRALDIKANALEGLEQVKEALFVVEQATEISPYSIKRQSHFASLAQKTHAHDKMAKATAAVLEMSRRSYHHHMQHYLNHFRALLSCAEHEREEVVKKQYIADAKQLINKASHEDGLFVEFDEHLFTAVCSARVFSCEGEHLKAKRSLSEVSNELASMPENVANELVPESISTLLNIGEFEQANALIQNMPSTQNNTNSNSIASELLKEKIAQSQLKIDRFNDFNRQGIESYKKGNFSYAIEQFEAALALAPMNTGSALNLLQALLKLTLKEKDNAHTLLARAKQLLETVTGLTLPEQHQIRLTELQIEFDRMSELFRF